MTNTNKKAYLLLVLLNLVLVIWFFSPLLFHLNSSIINIGGDSFKNYFTYLYFIKFDIGHDFTGMGYPFSEHMTFTDNMPAIAWTMAKLRTLFPSVPDYSLLVMHALLILSFPLGSYFGFKILRSFRTDAYWAAISGTFITFLSPQIIRLTGHYGMAFVCVIPMYIHYLNSYSQTEKKRYLFYLFVLGFVTGFLHVYNLGIGLVFATAFLASFIFIEKKYAVRQRLRIALAPFVSVLLSVIFLKLTLFLTDDITDRPQFPPGILNACTSPKEILTSTLLPLGYTFQFLTGNHAADVSEGYIYLGFVSIVSILLAFVLRIVIVAKKRTNSSSAILPNTMNTWIAASIICLLVALGVPFKWGLESLLDQLSSFRQLRSLGRFAWPFYYIMSIYVCILIGNVYANLVQKKHKKASIALLLSVMTIWTVQASGYVNYLNEHFVKSHDNYLKLKSSTNAWEPWLKQHGYSPHTFQASIGLPFFYIGGDKIGMESIDPGEVHRPLASLALGYKLPMMNVMMSRGSWERCFNIVRLFDGALTSFPYEDSLNAKPFLLLKSNVQPIDSAQSRLLKYSKYIGEFEGSSIYSFDIKYMLSDNRRIADSTRSLVYKTQQQEGLLEGNAFYYANHFDNVKSKTTLAGNGALGNLANHTLIATINHPMLENDQDYTLSIWSLCDSVNDHLSYFDLKQYDSAGNLIDQSDILSARSTLVLNFWFKAEKLYKVKAGVTKIEVYATGYHEKDNHIAIDEIAMWPVGYTYFYKDYARSQVLINNRPLPSGNSTKEK